MNNAQLHDKSIKEGILYFICKHRDTEMLLQPELKTIFEKNSIGAKGYEWMMSYYLDTNRAPSIIEFQTQFPDAEFIDYEVQGVTSADWQRLLRQHAFQIKSKNIFTSYIKSMQGSDFDEILSYARKLNIAYSEYINSLAVKPKSYIDSLNELYEQYLKTKDNYLMKFMPTGFKELDKMIGGWQKDNDYVCIAARSGVGKSWIAMKIAREAMRAGYKVAYYSGEMSSEQVYQRLITLDSGISNYGIVHGNESIVNTYKNYIDNVNITGSIVCYNAYDLPGNIATVENLKSIVKKEQFDLLIVDQITWLSSGQYFGNNETAEFAAISKQLREAQLELKIPFICLHQLNRSAYLNADLSDGLYGSDKLKQDCSMIICIKDSTDENGNLFLDFTMSKNRSGCKDSTLKYQVDYDTGVFKCVSAEVPDANQIVNSDSVESYYSEESPF